MCDKNLVFPAIFKKDGETYMVAFPDLAGCFSAGESLAEAYLNARDALALYLHDNDNVPAPSNAEDVIYGADEYLMLVTLDEANNIKYVNDVDMSDIIKKP